MEELFLTEEPQEPTNNSTSMLRPRPLSQEDSMESPLPQSNLAKTDSRLLLRRPTEPPHNFSQDQAVEVSYRWPATRISFGKQPTILWSSSKEMVTETGTDQEPISKPSKNEPNS